ncbi:9184_t:CDS:2 [Dentiscutata erythropus]|uniref:9184_t:CDS:1 n=1 Tax=Dentiscutata erythropus TaxID=1348616 RepID=A0A9N9IE84_9GLOM|nr:9184_t:CDS:2 [Dentiscutata erythropus]
MTIQEKLTPFIVCDIKSARKIFVKWFTCQYILIFILIVEVLISIILINKSKHSYLYTDPYEPIVHGTFETFADNKTELWNSIVRRIGQTIRDLYGEIMVVSRGFGHPNYDGFVPY